MSTEAPRPSFMRSILFVALRDLLNEKLISLCLVLSVVAVLAPILLLASVKVGFIDRLKSDFIQDPSFREIRPADATLRDDQFIDTVKAWPGVIYAMPSVMLVPREVDVFYDAGGRRRATEARLLPSDADDPLYVKLEGTPPTEEQVVVTADLAAAAGLDIGSTFSIAVDRVENDERRRVEIELAVSGIIPEEMLPQPTILGAPELDRDVESYRAGISVPDRGWSGLPTIPRQSASRILVLSERALGEVNLSNLRIRAGASRVEAVPAADLPAVFGLAAGSVQSRWTHFYVADRDSRAYSGEDVRESAAVLRNEPALVLGVNDAISAQLFSQPVEVLGVDPRVFDEPDLSAIDWRIDVSAPYGLNDGVLIPAALATQWEALGRPRVADLEIAYPSGSATSSLTLEITIAGIAPTDAALASPSLVAMIARGNSIPIAFDRGVRSIVEQSTGYRGFRVIAGEIDVVPELVDNFVAAGVTVRAKSDDILKLRQLDRSLDLLVLVVAAVALAGGFSILSASFFANVQRKKVDYATMRLIGMRKRAVFAIPLVQAVVVAVLGYGLSVALYAMVAVLLNQVIAVELGFGGQLSKLYPEHFAFVAAFVVGGACVASLWASREATRIDPAQALRAA